MTDGASLADSPKREYRRVWRQAFGVLIATYLIGVVVLSIFSLLGTPADWWGVALFVVFVAMTPLLFGFTWLLLRRRFWPANQAVRWSNGSANAAWMALDGAPYPLDADEALARLDGRVGVDVVAMRASSLAWAKRSAEQRALLDGWSPTEPVDVARRARSASTLSLLEGGADDLSAAWTAASVIPDPDDRAEQQAMVCLECARRQGNAGDDPFPKLVEARRLLGVRAAEFDTDADQGEMDRARRYFVVGAFVPAALFAVIGLAAWGGLLG